MALFVLRKLLLQTRMRSHQDFWSDPSSTSILHVCEQRTAKALARLRGCAGSPEPLLVTYVISTIISWAGSNINILYSPFTFSSFILYCFIFFIFSIILLYNKTIVDFRGIEYDVIYPPVNNVTENFIG